MYSFSYGNVGIVSLGPELGDPGLFGYSKGARVRWLEGVLEGWRVSASIDFIVAFFHECAFSTGNGHGSDGGVRAALAPLFARYQVDLVVRGHNHVDERTNPLLYDPATNSAKSSKQAVAVSPAEPAEVWPVYDGTAGTPRYGWTGMNQTDRNFAAGTGSGTTVVGDAKAQVGPWINERECSLTYERVDWSQARAASLTGWCSPGSRRPDQRAEVVMESRWLPARAFETPGLALDRAREPPFVLINKDLDFLCAPSPGNGRQRNVRFRTPCAP